MDPRTMIMYYARQGYARPLVALCEDTLKRRGNEAGTLFWKAYGSAREGNFAQAVRDCVTLRARRESEYPALVALSHYHRCSKLIDRDALASAAADTPAALERAPTPAHVLAGTFLWLTGDERGARACVERALRENVAHEGALALRAWLDCTCGTRVGIGGVGSMGPLGCASQGPGRKEAEAVAAAVGAFEGLLAGAAPGHGDPDMTIGYIRALIRIGNLETAIDVCTALSAAAPWYGPALTARAEVLVRAGEWDAAREAVSSALAIDGYDIEACRLGALIALSLDGSGIGSTGQVAVGMLVKAVGQADPRNPRLLAEIARPLARCCGRDGPVLHLALSLVETAVSLDPDASVLACEVGHIKMLGEDWEGAMRAFKDAARLDESNSDAVAGLISVQLAQGTASGLSDASSQLEMFRLIATSVGKGAELAVLEAGVAARGGPEGGLGTSAAGSRSTQLSRLQAALRLHAQSVSESVGYQAGPAADALVARSMVHSVPTLCPPSLPDVHAYYACVDAELILSIARQAVISGSGTSTRLYDDCTDVASQPVRLALQALACSSSLLPGFLPSLRLAAQIRANAGDADGAQRAVGRVLAKDPGCVESHLLLARVELNRGQPRSALSALERALSVSFSVQAMPAYHTLRARAFLAVGKKEESLAAVVAGLKQHSPRSTGKDREGISSMGAGLSLLDRSQLSSLHVTILLGLNRVPEAVVAGEEGMAALRGSVEEGSACLSLASIALALGDPDAALDRLASVLSSSSSFAAVLEAKAEIYLKHRRDRSKYISCFEEAVRRARSPATLVSLGDAYCRVGQPEAAIHVYGSALVDRSGDTVLACKIGEALIAAHDYRAALTYYTAALKGDAAGALSGALSTAFSLAEAAGPQSPAPWMKWGQVSLPATPNFGAGLDKATLRAKLTSLLVQLGKHGDAKALIGQAIAETEASIGTRTGISGPDVVTLRLSRQNLLLMARVQCAAGDAGGALVSTEAAYRLVLRALEVARNGGGRSVGGRDVDGDGSGGRTPIAGGEEGVASIDEERRAACLVALHLASAAMAGSPPSIDRARSALLEAVRHAEGLPNGGSPASTEAAGLSLDSELGLGAGITAVSVFGAEGGQGSTTLGGRGISPPGFGGPISLHEQAALALARFHLQHAEDEECAAVCKGVTSFNPGSGEAKLLLADVQFRAGDTTAAIFHYASVLEDQPCNWHVLLRLIGLLKRAGRVGEIDRFLKAALKASAGAESEAGYNLIQGLLHKWKGEAADGIRALNAARSSRSFALLAVEAMVHLYLSPDGDPLWIDRDAQAEGSVAQDAGQGSGSAAKGKSAAVSATATASSREQIEAVSLCTRLVEELPPGLTGQDAPTCTVLRAYISIVEGRARCAAGCVEDAIGSLATVLESDPDHVPALLALATAFMAQGQSAKARNTVKRLLKTPGADVAHAEEAAAAWLLLADIYTESGKLDQAQEAVGRALAVDASCSRAHEALGGIAERELRYAESAALYEKAWQASGKTAAPVGYKLAFNLLKAREFTRALDTARDVLKASPAYPRIREDIIARAQTLIRP